MNSFELELLDEKSRAGAEFMARVVDEIRRALATEKASRKITQQAIATKIGTSRSVINRQVQGFENLSARRIGELLWAVGWEPHFEARKIPFGENENPPSPLRPVIGSMPADLVITSAVHTSSENPSGDFMLSGELTNG